MSTGSIIKLNVGGTPFTTLKSTLTKQDGFLKTLVETDLSVTKNEHGAIFIDRPAKHFYTILNYLRDGDVEILERDCQEILKEAQYFLLPGLVEKCRQKVPKIRYLNSFEENLNALVYTKKKAVLVVYYEVVNKFTSACKMASIIDRYEEDIDVYFSPPTNKTPMKTPLEWLFGLYLKSSAEMVTGRVAQLDEIVRKNVRVSIENELFKLKRLN